VEAFEDWARTTVACVLKPGERLRIVKFIAYGWSSRRTRPALRDQVEAALTAARMSGWEGLLHEQRCYLDEFWDAADVRIEGDDQVQQAVRFGMFHVLQAGARVEDRPVAAKGLTGPGYDGHVFWDSEMYVLPTLTYIKPETVEEPLKWRHSTLWLAQERAATLALKGAAFPWRTIRGQECSGYWPAGTAAFHIGADIADAVRRYVNATGDVQFERDFGLELLVETARMWQSLGHTDRHGVFHLDGLTGPDEYTAVADDNLYTNLMAQRNLRSAAKACERHPDKARELGVEADEVTAWCASAEAMKIPYDEELGVHPQVAGFTRYQEWDFENTPDDKYPLFLHYPYFDLYRKQVLKQADVVLAMHWRGDAFTPEEKARNFAYYEPRTVRDSSLSSCTQAVIAAEVGHLDLAYAYLAEAALMDLHDLHSNTREGLHIAALAGTWLALVAGFGGFRDHDDVPLFAPRLPSGITRMDFSLLWRGKRLRVDVRPDQVEYSLRNGDAGTELELRHHGETVRVNCDQAVTVAIPPLADPGPAPTQPRGREPVPRPKAPSA
jgi:alpha,alpha-trehalose phosphorylase